MEKFGVKYSGEFWNTVALLVVNLKTAKTTTNLVKIASQHDIKNSGKQF